MQDHLHIKQLAAQQFCITRSEYNNGIKTSQIISCSAKLHTLESCLDAVSRMNQIACCHVKAAGFSSLTSRARLWKAIQDLT